MLTIWIPGKGLGKRRGTYYNGRMILPEKYRNRKNEMVSDIFNNVDMSAMPLNYACDIKCYFVNFLTSDSDNLTGMYIDALVTAGVLKNDSSSYVVSSMGKFVETQSKKKDIKKGYLGTLIEIKQAKVDYINFTDEEKLLIESKLDRSYAELMKVL